ncbi:MAG: glycosyltransferase family 2 protein [Ruminococcaceae bacterium]|nr:glycosyltransferase family 2 protein [Oscillospiraceae bacterium]
MITVFTPTYNRGYILGELYQSLLNQTCFDFEWLIVDDGSTDNTEELVKNWLDNGKFAVRYCKKANGGKPSAINCGLQLAKGEYFWIIDSDDTATKDGVQTCLKWIASLPQGEKFAGVGGLRGDKKGGIIGTTFSGEYVDVTTLERAKHNIGGDKSEVFLTSVIKQFPFPEFKGEKFVPEALVWNRIAKAGYKIRWFNEIVHITEYLEDGMTKNVDSNLIRNWQGYSLYVKELLAGPAPVKDKFLIGGAYCLRGIKKLCKKY